MFILPSLYSPVLESGLCDKRLIFAEPVTYMDVNTTCHISASFYTLVAKQLISIHAFLKTAFFEWGVLPSNGRPVLHIKSWPNRFWYLMVSKFIITTARETRQFRSFQQIGFCNVNNYKQLSNYCIIWKKLRKNFLNYMISFIQNIFSTFIFTWTFCLETWLCT